MIIKREEMIKVGRDRLEGMRERERERDGKKGKSAEVEVGNGGLS